jgi:hypothetical protein
MGWRTGRFYMMGGFKDFSTERCRFFFPFSFLKAFQRQGTVIFSI